MQRLRAMLRLNSLIELVISKIRSKKFEFDKRIDSWFVLSLILRAVISYARGMSIWARRISHGPIYVGKCLQLECGRGIQIGKGVVVGDYCKFNGLGVQGLLIGDYCSIGDFSKLIVSSNLNDIGEYIRLGSNVGLGDYSRLGGSGGVSIGSDTIIANYFSAHPENHNFTSTDLLIREQGTTRHSIDIGSNCWIGAKVTVLAGVVIGDNCVIAAGSVVTRSFTSGTLIGGCPAKVIKKIG